MDRKCGECTLCCTLLPVKGLNKGASVRCRHQRSLLHQAGAGCAVYHKEGFPVECALWNCRWLMDDTTEKLQRPDRSHYVIDIIPDFITGVAQDGREQKAAAIQVWIDPRYPDAHRDPAFREWLVENAGGCVALIRRDSENAMVLIPPQMSSTGDWEEVGDNRATMTEATHTGEQIANVLTGLGAMK